MVDGCLLLVDATEGAMAQTKYVLGKALSMGLRPIVVLNKIDRPAATPARCDEVHSELFDLFATMGATDEQLDFPVVFASGARDAREHQSAYQVMRCARGTSLAQLLTHVPSPAGLARILSPEPSASPLQGARAGRRPSTRT